MKDLRKTLMHHDPRGDRPDGMIKERLSILAILSTGLLSQHAG